MSLAQETRHFERRSARADLIGDRYLAGLAVVLAGYTIVGKPFAYVGLAPLYIGELALALGIIAFLISRCGIACLVSYPNLFLGLLIVWVVARTLPYLSQYGVDALRDSVIVVYGVFAFIVTALLLERPARLPHVISFLGILSTIFVPLAPLLVMMSDDGIRAWEAGQLSLAFVKPGTTAVHLAAAALLVHLGFRRSSLFWLGLVYIGLAVAGSQNRGGMLAALFMLSFAAIASGRVRQLAAPLASVVIILSLAFVFDLSLPTYRERDISVAQLTNNFLSIFGWGEVTLDNTKLWRLEWWNSIINYTFDGPYFWTGKGFGINLAVDDGTASELDNSLEPILRSPHNSHLNILARSGVPGLVLWIVTLGSWSLVLLTNIARANLHGDRVWADFFILTFCYGVGLIIDSTFDVTLEGPMGGIWFWCVFGVGTGATMIYRADLRRRARLRLTGAY
jgi:hypothetical protein